jgi:Adenylate and Guanylate cyclase catalytic domain
MTAANRERFQAMQCLTPDFFPFRGDELAKNETEAFAQVYRNYIPKEDNPYEPVSDLFYPIINELGRIEAARGDDYDPSQHSIVGMIAASFYWRDMIRGNLPRDVNGLVIAFTNPCNDAFTYQIDGNTVTYLGRGDLHDTSYEHLGLHKTLTDVHTSSSASSDFAGVPIDRSFCPLTLHLYPSDDMKEDFTTSRPILFTIGTIAIFAFTSIVFFLYDYFVERRQRIVMHSATRTANFVSSLFPEKVRDQLLSATSGPSETGGGRLLPFLRDNHQDKQDSQLNCGPIADLYPETTVFFADISGFTAWSSIRQPTQVFHLLETLYGAFDRIAKVHGVFKVETIGDSYVAVVGLPTPRKNHAIVMVRFAQDCLDKMRVLTLELETTLGPVRS